MQKKLVNVSFVGSKTQVLHKNQKKEIQDLMCDFMCLFVCFQESLARLQRAFARKWEFIFMQAEAQAK